jgi:hypothetical protein
MGNRDLNYFVLCTHVVNECIKVQYVGDYASVSVLLEQLAEEHGSQLVDTVSTL